MLFWDFVNQDPELKEYVNSYYRTKLTEAIFRQQLMTMNGKNGAVCAFIYQLIPIFGRKVKKGILRGLREQNVISMVYQKILILDVDYLKQFVQA